MRPMRSASLSSVICGRISAFPEQRCVTFWKKAYPDWRYSVGSGRGTMDRTAWRTSTINRKESRIVMSRNSPSPAPEHPAKSGHPPLMVRRPRDRRMHKV
jgi:hypothetical protein